MDSLSTKADGLQPDKQVSKPDAPETIWTDRDAVICSHTPFEGGIEYRRVKTCKWAENKQTQLSTTDCGNAAYYLKQMKYCPFCGGRLEIDNG